MSRRLIFSARRKDFRIERIRGTGPGGQHRNKTESCVRITHLETGMTEYCCETRSQHRNQATAFRRLAKRLAARYAGEQQRQRYGAGHKRIRTYHEPDDRVTDHRSGKQFSFRATVSKGDIGPLIAAGHMACGASASMQERRSGKSGGAMPIPTRSAVRDITMSSLVRSTT